MNHRYLGPLALGAVAVLGAGCGDDEASPTATGPAVAAEASAVPVATEPPATDPPATQPPATQPPATQPPATDPPATDPPAAPAPLVEITAADYAYAGVPASVASGTELRMVNSSDVELHEIVAFRLADDDTRTPDDILAGGPDGPPPGEFAGVIVAPPGAPSFGPEGPLVLGDAGRYLLVCFIPVGVDPQAYTEAKQAEAAGADPVVFDGPPHAAFGMIAELTVES